MLMREKFKWVSDCVTYRTPAFIIRAAIVSIFFRKQIFTGIVGLIVHVELQSSINIGVFCIFILYFNIVFIFYLYNPFRLTTFQRFAIGECFIVPYAGQHGVFAPPLVVSVVTGKRCLYYGLASLFLNTFYNLFSDSFHIVTDG